MARAFSTHTAGCRDRFVSDGIGIAILLAAISTDSIDLESMAGRGVVMSTSNFLIYGVCGDCRKKNSNANPI